MNRTASAPAGAAADTRRPAAAPSAMTVRALGVLLIDLVLE
ncbi:hypothetical protein ACTIVE_3769 [Actinomadura verrucosospora]|uniref:Uncharacterized protein n=1 Tax=Actinomadura verrucosospora TaxID=46165 RepID=A0A7D3VYI9_ACTVE|nr:hypothetical protein ACTIVE_3769 [Actinomadura verrucosospora]